MRIIVALLMGAGFFWQFSTPIIAADALTMSVRAGFDGFVRLGTWLPIEVEVDNRGPDLSADLELQVQANADPNNSLAPVIQSTRVILPSYSHKRFRLDIYVPPASHVSARIVAKGDALVQHDVPLETVPSGELLCGVLSRNAATFDFLPAIPLSARQHNVRLAHLDRADLPAQGEVLSSLDCLILSNPASGNLTQEQAAALQNWVASGGLLIIVGGPSWQKTTASLPQPLLPVKITGSISLQSADNLAAFAQQKIADTGPWLVSQAALTDGKVIVQQDDVPLIVAAKRGFGAVFYLALDPAVEPLRSWPGSAYLWRYILSNASIAAASPGVASRQYSGWGRPPNPSSSDAAGPPLSTTRAGLFILAYFLILVPLGYIGLRRFRRVELRVLFSSAVIAGTTLAGFSMADANREPDVMFYAVTIIRSWDSATPASAHTFVSAFSPNGGKYDITAPRDSLLSSPSFPAFNTPFGAANQWTMRVQKKGSPTIQAFDVTAGGTSGFAADSQIDPVEIASDLSLHDGQLTGIVTNRSRYTLQDSAVIVGSQVARLGTLQSGKSASVALAISKASDPSYLSRNDLLVALFPNTSTPNETQQNIIDSALNANYDNYARIDLSAVTLLAWLPDNLTPLHVADAKSRESQRTLMISSVPVHFTTRDYTHIPAQILERRPISVNTGDKVGGVGLTLGVGESVSTEYSLPALEGQFDVEALALNTVGTINGRTDDTAAQALGSASIFDWQKADWTDVPLAFGLVSLLDPQRYVSPLGAVRLRYTFWGSPTDDSLIRLSLSTFDIVVGGRAK